MGFRFPSRVFGSSRFYLGILCLPLIPLTHFAVIDGYAVTNSEAKQFKHSPTIEKERPELNEETKRLIASYRSDPADANLKALRKQVEIYYDKERVERRSNLF